MLTWLKERAVSRDKAAELYGRLVAQARWPVFYEAYCVPDTPEGRFEMIVLHLFLVLERLKVEGAAGAHLGQLLLERFVTDMDDSMREMGVGDLAVPKKVRRAAAAVYERASAYRTALEQPGNEILAARLAAYAGRSEKLHGAATLAVYVRNALASLAAQDGAEVMAGRPEFAAAIPKIGARQ